jgi:hypothetical protein
MWLLNAVIGVLCLLTGLFSCMYGEYVFGIISFVFGFLNIVCAIVGYLLGRLDAST